MPKPRVAADAASSPSRRSALTQAGSWLAGAGLGPTALAWGLGSGTAVAQNAVTQATLTLDPAGQRRPVNRGLLGSNVEWPDRGDELLDAQGQLKPAMLSLVQAMGPTALRYPGGLHSDTYHWAAGMGPLAERGSNQHAFSRQQQTTLMGTLEYLELCEVLGAEPLITVNMVTGTAEEAAAWVRAVNVTGLRSRRTGRLLPPVRNWELGNEPYLKEALRPDLWLEPAEFARRAAAWAAAMKQVDPGIRLGLPMTPDTRRGIPVTAYPGWCDTVYRVMAGKVDWLAAHFGYMPFFWTRPPDQMTMYKAAMSSAPTVAADLQTFRRSLAAVRPDVPVAPFWMTEYHAILSFTTPYDALTASPLGALYVADLLRVLASGGVERAHQWSLSANGWFGAIHRNAHARPVHLVLRLFREQLQGSVVPILMYGEKIGLPAIAAAAAQASMPLVDGLLCDDGRTVRALLINKDPNRSAQVSLAVTSLGSFASAGLSTLTSPDLFRTSDLPNAMVRGETALARPVAGQPTVVRIAPASVALVSLRRA